MKTTEINKTERPFVTWLVRIIGMILVGYAVYTLTVGILNINKAVNEGLMGINWEYKDKSKDAPLTMTFVGKNSAAGKAGVKEGDIVMLINGLPPDRYRLDEMIGARIQGVAVELTLKRGQEIVKVSMTKQLVSFIKRLVTFLSLLVFPLILLLYYLVGLWGSFKRPSLHVNLMALVCFSMATLLYTAVISVIPDRNYIFSQLFFSLQNILLWLSYAILPYAWLLLFLNYPEKHRILKERKRLIIAMISFIPFAFIVLSFLMSPRVPPVYNVLHFLFLYAYIHYGFKILERGTKHASTLRKRRQYRLMEHGLKVGMYFPLVGGIGALFVAVAFPNSGGGSLAYIVIIVFILTQIGGLALPYTFVNTMIGSELIETATSTKRKINFAMATVLLFIGYFLITLATGKLVTLIFSVYESNFIILFTLLIALFFYPLNRLMLRKLDHFIYPEKQTYAKLFHEFYKTIQGESDVAILERKLAGWLKDHLKITPIAVSVADHSKNALPLKTDTPGSAWHLFKAGRTLFWDQFQDEEILLTIPDSELDWAIRNHISLTLPMQTAGETVGLLHIGYKENREDFTGLEMSILRDIANKTAEIVQSLKLQAEQLEKNRLAGELEMAKKIQMQLMPQKIPQNPGVLLHGFSQPCYEIGGDYYDIFKLQEDQILLAVADVCGKGAGAALLMSNLQAALRSMTGISKSLEEMVFHLNRIVFQNTSAGQFITLFLGILDLQNKHFSFINAGHMPGLIVSKDGQVKQMERTNVALGLKEEESYVSAKETVENGDLVVLYTDGIAETFNRSGEIFGTKRFIKLLSDNLQKHPEEISSLIMERIDKFSENTPAEDDITFILASVSPKTS